MLWLNVYEGCLLPTNILSSTSPVSATVPRCPGRGTFLPSLLAGRVWWESRGRSVTASPPQFPAKCGHHRHQAPGHQLTWPHGVRHQAPHLRTSTRRYLHWSRAAGAEAGIQHTLSSGKEIRCQIFLVLSSTHPHTVILY